jgi:hypothetical protein
LYLNAGPAPSPGRYVQLPPALVAKIKTSIFEKDPKL